MEWKRSNYSTFGNSICDASIFIPFPAGIIFRAIHLSVVRRLGCKSSAPSLPNVYPSPTRANWILVPVSDYHTLVYTTGTSRVGRARVSYIRHQIALASSRSVRPFVVQRKWKLPDRECKANFFFPFLPMIDASEFARKTGGGCVRRSLFSRKNILWRWGERRGWIGSLGVMDCLLWWRGN